MYPLESLVCHGPVTFHHPSREVIAGRVSDAETAPVCANVSLLMMLFGHDDLSDNFRRAHDILRSGAVQDRVNRLVSGGDHDNDS